MLWARRSTRAFNAASSGLPDGLQRSKAKDNLVAKGHEVVVAAAGHQLTYTFLGSVDVLVPQPVERPTDLGKQLVDRGAELGEVVADVAGIGLLDQKRTDQSPAQAQPFADRAVDVRDGSYTHTRKQERLALESELQAVEHESRNLFPADERAQ